MRANAIFLVAGLVAQGGWAADGNVGLPELYRLDRLPAFRESVRIGSVSSYDRTGGNDDGFSGRYSFVRKDEEGVVLADLKGPGVIYRVWTPTPTDDVLEFVFDGEERARVSVRYRDLFLGKHPAFPRPLVGFGAGGYYCYVPMAFERSCVVRIRAPKTQFYQINYAIYGPGTGLKTFDPAAAAADPELKKACELFGKSGQDITGYTTPPGAELEWTRTEASVGPRGSRTVFESAEGGRILGLRMSPAGAMAGKARDLVLRISFDGETPAVECPLGDFFGYAWGEPATRSLLVGTSGGTNYCYYPMPFEKSARVEVVSERDRPVALQVEVAHAPVARKGNEGKFYAIWRRENPTVVGEPYTFIQAAGRGHLAGVVLQSQGFESGKTLFFEGDDQTTIDGELVVHGTGSEDFFNGGWYDVPDRWEKRISFPLSGCLGYAKHLGRTGAYRVFLGDAYPYRESLLQTIEHGGEKNSIPTDYCSVSFLYSDRPVASQMPALEKRAVQDMDEVVFPAFWQTPIYAWSFQDASLVRRKEKIGNEEVRYLSLTGTNSDWFGPHFYSPICEVPVAGNYGIYIEVVKGPGQGMAQLFQNENPVGEPVDLYAAERVKSGRLKLGTLELEEGKNNLMLKLVGKNEKSSGLGLDLIQVICARERAMPLSLKAVGTNILNSRNERVILRGVNTASLEWTSDGEGRILESINRAIRDWGVNVIRLPLAQDRWFGKGPEQKDDGEAYRGLVRQAVDLCATQGCYIVLDLHWSDCGEWGQNIGQHSMPDRNSVLFWKDCAAMFANHPAVIFDLYNEPHDVSWDVWLKGGMITDRPNTRRAEPAKRYEAVGMQELLDTVRATGAKNLVIAGGLDWAYDLRGILEGRRLSDPEGNGVVYANHAYNNKGHPVEVWMERMDKAAAELPIIVSEYGGSGGPKRRVRRSEAGKVDWLLQVMQTLQDREWSWIAWDFHPHAGPPLLAGWDYRPTEDFGVFVKQALAGALPRYTPPADGGEARAVVTLPPAMDVTGKWGSRIQGPLGPVDYTFDFVLETNSLTGKAIRDLNGKATEVLIRDGRVNGDEISFSEPLRWGDREIKVEYEGTITNGRLHLTRWIGERGSPEMVAERVE